MAHTLNGHKGFCIEYDYEQLQKSLSNGFWYSVLNVRHRNDVSEFSNK